MKVSFYLPENLRPTPAEEKAWLSGEGVLIYPDGVICVAHNWIYQTWFFLRQSGVECELVSEIPSEGILIANSDLLSTSWTQLEVASRHLFIVNILADSLSFPFSHLYLVQNPLHAKQLPGAIYMPHWPHPNLRLRDPDRGDLFENICFYGNPDNIDPYLLSHQWKKELYDELGLHFFCQDLYSWHDFSKTDVALGIRSFSRKRYIHKPGSKLYNAWLAGVPFIGGNDVAFSSEGERNKDYLVATSLGELMHHLHQLKEDPTFRYQLVAAGNRKAAQFSQEATLKRWQHLVQEQLPQMSQEWNRLPYRQQVRFWKRKEWQRKLNAIFNPVLQKNPAKDSTWAVVVNSLAQIKVFEQEKRNFLQKATELKGEGNQELASRWEHLTLLLDQLIYLKNIHGVYNESPYVPTPPQESYAQEGDRLVEHYLEQSRLEMEAGNLPKAQRLMGWARSGKEWVTYYRICAQQVYNTFCQTYYLDEKLVNEQLREYEKQHQEIENSSSQEALELFKYTQKALTFAQQTAHLFQELQGESVFSAMHAHDKRLAFFWAHFTAFNMFHLVLAVKNARFAMIPLWNHIITSAQKASRSRYRAFIAAKEERPYEAAFLRKAGSWAANSAKIGLLDVNSFVNQQLALSLKKEVKKTKKHAARAVFWYSFLGRYLVHYLECWFPQQLNDYCWQRLARWIGRKVETFNQRLFEQVSEHILAPDVGEKEVERIRQKLGVS